MPKRPLSELRPRDFPKIGDEEDAFDSNNEDTDDECMEDGGENNEDETREINSDFKWRQKTKG